MTRLDCLTNHPELMAHLMGVGALAMMGHTHYSDDDDHADDFVIDLPPGVERFSELKEDDEPIKYIELRCHAAFTHHTLTKIQEAGFKYVQCDPDYSGQVVVTLLTPGQEMPDVMFRL